jgi:cytochrome c-type biogenesis protein CcmE
MASNVKAHQTKMKWLIGGVVMAMAVAVISMLSLGDNVVYFYTPDEAFEKAGELQSKIIKVGGMVKAGTVEWQAEDLALSFIVTDFKDHEITVKHTGTPPDMFKENSGVVVEGRIASDGKSMTSHRLMVKHSEEYVTPDTNHSIDKELLKKSIFKEEP